MSHRIWSLAVGVTAIRGFGDRTRACIPSYTKTLMPYDMMNWPAATLRSLQHSWASVSRFNARIIIMMASMESLQTLLTQESLARRTQKLGVRLTQGRGRLRGSHWTEHVTDISIGLAGTRRNHSHEYFQPTRSKSCPPAQK